MTSVLDLFSLRGRTAVVVGAAGVLARHMVVALSQAGARVALLGRNESRLQAVRPDWSARCYAVDVTDVAALREVAAAIERDFGHIDIVVNAVGGNRKDAVTDDAHSFFDLPQQALTDVIHLNLMAGAILPAQVFGPALVCNPRGGCIINISSMSAMRPLTRVGAYSAAKAAVSNFTRWLALEMAREHGEKVRVNAIAPGFFVTDQNRDLLRDPVSGLPTERARAIVAHTPMRRFGTPDELRGALIWLASDAAKFVTGIVVPVDGGFSAFAGV